MNPSDDASPNLQHFILLLLISSIWGSSFILIKMGLKSFTALEVGSLRIFLSFAVLLPYLFIKPKAFLLLKKQFWPLLGVAAFGSGIPAFLFSYAQTKIESSLAGMLNSLVPLFTLLIGILFFNIKSTPKKIGGVLIGLVGSAAIILQNGNNPLESDNLAYGLLVILATICYGIGANLLKTYLSSYPAIHVTTMIFVVIGPLTGIYIAQTDILHRALNDPDALKSLGYIFVLSFMGTAVALVMFNKLIQTTSALFASMVTYLIPGFAIFWGVLDGETVYVTQILGLLLIFAGIYLTSRNKKADS